MKVNSNKICVIFFFGGGVSFFVLVMSCKSPFVPPIHSFQREDEEREAKLKEKREAHLRMRLKLVTEEDIAKHECLDFRSDFIDPNEGIIIKVSYSIDFD